MVRLRVALALLMVGRTFVSQLYADVWTSATEHSNDCDMDDLPPLPTIDLGRWRHYKGNAYEVLGVARHSETLEPLVLYRPIDGRSGLWVRPFEMFVGAVEIDGVRRPRFERVSAVTAVGAERR